ncbi:sugar diacid recognition domain-containing protein [Cloacibacillus sp. An23]|uniref:CdaR family transcriptional regulator n=1 Tax=Cloacibacillus sp. An23 TaxID=1965591 RepID=UPI000B3AC2FF|nr:sugar diacid recognition domain-containing protein [Cloacibacillus sp. An23]OUO94115.1 hypothetical protein B5F39_05470 [Cloacibacillus sp. An23]
MRFGEIARDLVHTASRLLRGRIVNIMDTSGVIVASTDAQRIGTTHEGAREVVRTGRPVAIEKADVPRYPGAREGYNLPVFSDNHLMAVVGVYGVPEEVRDSAYILQAYTEQFFRQKAIERQSRISDGLRSDYIRILMNLSAGGGERLAELAGALNLKLAFPVRMLAFSVDGAADSLTRQQLLSRAAEELQSQRFIDPERDVWAVLDDRLLVLKSCAGDCRNYLSRALSCAEDACAAPVRLCAGHLCASAEDARSSGGEALTLGEAGESGVFDITEAGCRFSYLMRRTAKREEEFVGRMYRELCDSFSGRELETMLSTAEAYYGHGGSVTKAAEALHVHKNTLQYRMKRLWEACCPGLAGSFEREYLLRLCILYHRQLRLRTPLI